jgi:predicted O-methyltransferase YrrM
MADDSLDDYANALLGGEDAVLGEMRSDAEREGLPAIQVPPELGRLLTFLIKTRKARRVLEIGTLFGYSTVIMARALDPGGEVVSLEVDPRHARIARGNVSRAGVADRVRIVEGNALVSLSAMTGDVFDLVFIDADKATYPTYLSEALRLTRSGSLIVADNLWRGGSVTAPKDDNSAGAAAYNRALADDSRLLSLFLSTRGGQDAAGVSLVL